MLCLNKNKLRKLYLRVVSIFKFKSRSGTGDEELDKIINDAGYCYDAKKDIFYSDMNPWQRKMGYCRLYDEAAAPLGMIIDCEPVIFQYSGKRWLIEFWKGQYDLTTGCEIGVYNTKDPDVEIPGGFKGPFFYSVEDSDLLDISFKLYKGKKALFEREAKHWWLTGFKLGEFSEPSELSMDVSITLKDEAMCKAFLDSIKKLGYLEKELTVENNKVSFKYDKPRSPQPITRIPDTDALIQWKNKLMCVKYNEITGEYGTFAEKISAVKTEAPELFELIKNIGKAKQLYDIYGKIKISIN